MLHRFRYILIPLLGWLAFALRELRGSLWRILFGCLRIETRALASAVLDHLVARSRAVPLGVRPILPEFLHGVAGSNLRARGIRLHEVLSGDGCLFLYRRVPVLARVCDDYDSVDEFGSLSIHYPRGLLDPDRLLAEACAPLLDAEVSPEDREAALRVTVVSLDRTRARSPLGSAPRLRHDDSVAPLLRERYLGDRGLEATRAGRREVELEDLFLEPAHEACLRDLQEWLDSRSWYEARRIPWRRGYLFHGPPGTGKTSFALALAQRFRFEVLKFDLPTFDNPWLRRRWREHTEEGGKLILLEDLDAVFRGRENVLAKGEHPLTFDCLLGLLDGSAGETGCVVVVTTNHPEVLDPAIATVHQGAVRCRPGRIDRAVRFGFLDGRGKRALATRLLPDRPALVEELVGAADRPTAAEFQEMCIQRILEERERRGTIHRGQEGLRWR